MTTIAKTAVSRTTTVLVILAAALSGCASDGQGPRADAGTAPASAVADTRVVVSATAGHTPAPPETVLDTVARLKDDRSTLYSGSREQYSLYVGGILNAVYHTDSKQLTISADGAALAPAECEYSAQGELLARKDIPAAEHAQQIDDCNRLLKSLRRFVAPD